MDGEDVRGGGTSSAVVNYEVFFTSEVVPGSKISLCLRNLRYRALTQR